MISISSNLNRYLSYITQAKSDICRTKDHYFYENLDNKINCLLDDLNQYFPNSRLSLNKLVGEVCVLKQISYKLQKMALKIEDHANDKWLSYKMQDDILPSIRKIEKDWEIALKTRVHLPQSADYQQELARVRARSIKELSSETSESWDMYTCEKQTFNLLMEKLTDADLQNFDYQKLEGAFNLYSALTYATLLENYKTRLSPQSIKQDFLDRLIARQNKAVAVAQKVRFLKTERFLRDDQSPNGYTRMMDEKKAIYYYKLLSDVKDVKFNDPLNIQHDEIPLTILIHDISKEIFEAIHQLNYCDYTFFCLGSRDHIVTVEIRREFNREGKDEYRFINFNTGDGVDNAIRSHRLDQNKNLVKPLCITKLSLNAFDYEFIESMVSVTLGLNAIEDLYYWEQKYLVDRNGGQWEDNWGNWHPLQKRDSCPYSSLEFCFSSHIDDDDRMNLDIIKAEHSLIKQSKVVQWRRNQYQTAYQNFSESDSNVQELKAELDRSEKILQLVNTYMTRVNIDLVQN